MSGAAESTAATASDRGENEAFDILGIGMSMIDSIQVVDEFPAGSGVTESSVSAMMGGGPVPTALCAASVLGARTAIIDQVGNDWCADLIAGDYRKFGVDCRFLHHQNGQSSTFGSVIVRRSDGERHIVFNRGTCDELSLSQLPVADLEACSILHLNGRHWNGACEAARIVKTGGGRVSFDGGAHRFDSGFLPLLAAVDILIVARDFAEKLSETQDREEQIAALGQWNAEIVGITDGEKGSWFRPRGGSTFHQPAFPVREVVDTTGCGDVFHGAFLYAVARGEGWKESAAFASAAAAFSATALGGRGALPTCDSVAAMLKA